MFLQSTPSVISSQTPSSSSKFESTSDINSSVTRSLLLSVNETTNCLEICHFCRALTSSSTKTLVRCPDCHASYCRIEHKNFDWKSHKIICNQWRKRSDPDSFSADSLNSNALSVTCSSSSTTSENNSPQVRIIDTDDPDIQIIDLKTHKMEVPKTRKRTLDKNERVIKDHSKNILYKVTFQAHVKALADRGVLVNQHQATALRLKYIAEHVICSLNEYGWAVVDNFLGDKYCSKAFSEVEKLYEKGLFSAGRLMDHGKFDLNPEEIRSDKIFWFGTDNGDETIRKSLTVRLLISMIDSVVVNFKGRIPPFDIAGRSKAMIAIYPGNGTRYVKHVDNPVKDGRCITTIYYCNEGWEMAEHGGTLRLYPETSEVPIDVEPRADRLIFFWSDRRMPHEVLPVYRHRYAITIWYFDFEERRKAIEQNKGTESVIITDQEASTINADATPTTSGIVFNKDNVNKKTDKALQKNTFELLLNKDDMLAAKKDLKELQETYTNNYLLDLTRKRRSSSVVIEQRAASSCSTSSSKSIDCHLLKNSLIPDVRSNSLTENTYHSSVISSTNTKAKNVVNQNNDEVSNEQMCQTSDGRVDSNKTVQKTDVHCSKSDEEDIDDIVAQDEAKRK